ncbi:MAG: hypothetical protein Q8K82_12995 [Gemmatimonadaceae bacterium]|nr:hypothetical protein [Gemmatimonadaceae bacterium]
MQIKAALAMTFVGAAVGLPIPVAAQQPSDALALQAAQSVIRGRRYEISIPCDNEPSASMTFLNNQVTDRGAYNADGRYYPFRVRVNGEFSCTAFGGPAGAAFTYQVLVRLAKDDFGKWSARASEVESHALRPLSGNASSQANADGQRREPSARSPVAPSKRNTGNNRPGPGYDVLSKNDLQEPAIRIGAEGWDVALPASMDRALRQALPNFAMTPSQTLISSPGKPRTPSGDPAEGVRAVPNAIVADLNGDKKAEVALLGTIEGKFVVVVIESTGRTHRVTSFSERDASNRTESYMRWFPAGTPLPDRSGRKAPFCAISFWDDDNGGTFLVYDGKRWLRIGAVGD